MAITGKLSIFSFTTDAKLYDMRTYLHSFCRYILPYICICSHQQVLRRYTFLHFDRDYPSKVLYLFLNWKKLCKTFYGTDNSLTNFIFNVVWVSLHRKHNRRREKGRETFGGHKRHTGIWQKLHICQKLLMMQRLSRPITISWGSLHVSGKLTNYPSLKPTFYPKWEVSVNVGLGEG